MSQREVDRRGAGDEEVEEIASRPRGMLFLHLTDARLFYKSIRWSLRRHERLENSSTDPKTGYSSR